jgi:hypothetical protein
MSYYLSLGGKAVFILPNISKNVPTMSEPKLYFYAEGDLFYDLLRLDSAISNSFSIEDGILLGDLVGCRSLSGEYPPLVADSVKLARPPLPNNGCLAFSGCLFPRDGVEQLYRYESIYPDSIFHEQINGISYLAATYGFVLFNFPLSLMREPDNFGALRQALIYLGIDMNCGDINPDERIDIGDIVSLVNYLFHGGSIPDTHRADVNCDGNINVEDALVIINLIFRGGPGLNCCPKS